MAFFGWKKKGEVKLVNGGERLAYTKTRDMKWDMRISVFALMFILSMWAAVAFYSFYSTLNGYDYLKFNDLAIVLTLSSQFFTVIYAIPVFTNIASRRLPVFIGLVVFCVLAHMLSFGGSVFYHHIKQNTVDGTPVYQQDDLRRYQARIRFNTAEYLAFLESVRSTMLQRRADSLAGRGPSGWDGPGPRSKLYNNVIGELEGYVLAYQKAVKINGLDHALEEVRSAKTLSGLEEVYKSLPSMATQEESRIEDVGTAKRMLNRLRTRIDAAFNYGKDDFVPDGKLARSKLRGLVEQYPFVDASFDLSSLTGKGMLRSMATEVGNLAGAGFWSFVHNAKMGILIAVIVEFSVLLMNFFVRTYARKPAKQALAAKIRRIFFEAAAILARFYSYNRQYSVNVRGVEGSAVVDLISRARNVIRKHIDMRHKILVRDFLRGKYEYLDMSDEAANAEGTKRIRKFGNGAQGVYYRLDASFYEEVCKASPGSGHCGDHVLSCDESEVVDTYQKAVGLLVRYIIGFLERIGQVQHHGNEYWIDFDYFNEWVNLLVFKAGLHGNDASSREQAKWTGKPQEE